jgi:hypothetical protein
MDSPGSDIARKAVRPGGGEQILAGRRSPCFERPGDDRDRPLVAVAHALGPYAAHFIEGGNTLFGNALRP